MSRMTSILAWLQASLVITGFFALGIVLKMSGYPDAPALRWNPLAVFLREHGLWLLLAPALWVTFAIAAYRVDRGFLSYRIACVAGFSIAAVTTVLFIYSATH